ncbi:MAG TPA: type II 3-dehydroquinate dehydratase [Polyangiaceae bacterium]
MLSGPNLDRLGRREPAIYGSTTLFEVHRRLEVIAGAREAQLECKQSNHEGALIDSISAAADQGFAGILINAGSLTHTSYALYDALRGADLPVVEVHVSNPDARESFRRRSVIAPACTARVAGFGAASYDLALNGLLDLLDAREKSK